MPKQIESDVEESKDVSSDPARDASESDFSTKQLVYRK